VPDDQESRTKKRVIIAVGAVLVAAITTFGVLQLNSQDPMAAPASDAPPVQLTALDIANQFLTEYTNGRSAAAAKLTDDEAAATTQLTAVWGSLAPTYAEAQLLHTTAETPDMTELDEKFTLTWNLPNTHTWTYQSAMHLVKTKAGWRVHWQPTIIHPQLGPGQSLAVRGGEGQASVVDRDGTPLVVRGPGGSGPADPAVAPLLFPGMSREAGGQGAQGWYAAVTDAAGNDVTVVQGEKSGALVSMLSVPVQKAAQAAVDTQQQPAMLVAIQPSSGDILAVAQNAAAGSDPIALNGLYAPGSTFKMATATALIEAGIADVDTVVPCPSSTSVGQRTIGNDGGFQLGDVPLRTAFAKSCNTTFVEQSASLRQDALPDAAAQLGLGADFEIPGLTTEAGSVPAAANGAELAEDSIGQGKVQVSCFGMALAATTVAAGEARTPRLWQDRPTNVTTPYQGPPAKVIASLRTMMRSVVTSGTATALARYGQVFGKTGTAEVGNNGAAHGWFAGYRGDLAFATLVVNGGSSKLAVNVTGTFLGALG
jgi:transpeptidase family protein/MecA-like transpeptidase family protein